jgi:hypothetical protein
MTVKGGDLISIPLPDQLSTMFKTNLEKHTSGYIFENPKTEIDIVT